MGLLYGRARRLNSKNAGFRLGQWLGLAAFAFARQPEAGGAVEPSAVLPAFLLCFAVLWLTAAALICRAGSLPFGRPDAGAALLILGGLALSAELTFRLVRSDAFGGQAAAFDFGLKCTKEDDPASCERNAAFVPEFNIFGHCVQGTLSGLLLPGVERAAALGCVRCAPARPQLVKALSSFVAGQPGPRASLPLSAHLHLY